MKLHEIDKISVIEMTFLDIEDIFNDNQDLFLDITDYIYDKILMMEGVITIDSMNNIMKCCTIHLNTIRNSVDINYKKWVLWSVHQHKENLLNDYQDEFVLEQIDKLKIIQEELEKVLI